MKGEFLISTLTEFPTLKDPKGIPLPEVVLAGRSNVGKSSLINHLFGQKKLAKTSATPGKTQLLNFFLVDEGFLLVDLPGYGFAQAPTEEIKKWSSAIDSYMNSRPFLRLILALVDSRRGFSEEDLTLIGWAQEKQIPCLVIFTKIDKLSAAEQRALFETHPEAIPYSIKTPSSRDLVKKKMREILWG